MKFQADSESRQNFETCSEKARAGKGFDLRHHGSLVEDHLCHSLPQPTQSELRSEDFSVL